MSINRKIAKQSAVAFFTLINPYCTRIKIAGSIRREKEWVKDIEIVAIPKMGEVEAVDDNGIHKFFAGGPPKIKVQVNLLTQFLTHLEQQKQIKFTKNGPKYKQFFWFNNLFEIKIDLFLAVKENWGVIYAIRTGSREYNINIMSILKKRGEFKCKDGFLHNLHTGKIIKCLTEEDYFNAVDIPWKEPWDRNEKVF